MEESVANATAVMALSPLFVSVKRCQRPLSLNGVAENGVPHVPLIANDVGVRR